MVYFSRISYCFRQFIYSCINSEGRQLHSAGLYALRIYYITPIQFAMFQPGWTQPSV
jgi:hypothetical protein